MDKRTSEEVEKLRKERNVAKKEFEKEQDYEIKGAKKAGFVEKQKELAAKIEEEEDVKNKFDKRIEEANKEGFWRERRRMNRDEASTWIATKGEDENRIFDAEENKENVASYNEILYKKTPSPYHPYHDEVSTTIERLCDKSNICPDSTNNNNLIPTREEVKEIIKEKKDKKATSDWKNSILKRGGEPMVDLIIPVIRAFWQEEEAPSQWYHHIYMERKRRP